MAAVARSAWAPIFKAEGQSIAAHEFVDAVGGDGVVELAGAVVADGSEEGAFGVGGVAGFVQVVVQQFLGAGVQRDVAGLVAFAVHAQVRDAAAGVDVLDLQATEFFAAQAVIEQGGEQRPVAQAFEASCRCGRFIELPGLLVGDRRRLAFVAVDLGALDAFHGVGRHGVLVGQVLI